MVVRDAQLIFLKMNIVAYESLCQYYKTRYETSVEMLADLREQLENYPQQSEIDLAAPSQTNANAPSSDDQ